MAERVVRDIDPAQRVEREARLRAAATLSAGGAWIDLRATSGPAADDPPYDGSTPLVDDFADDDALLRLREAAGVGALVTAFETIEYVPAFAPLVEGLIELSAQHAATVVLAVPNDAFGEISGPGRATTWTDGAFAELRSMLPAEHVVLHQLALRGTAIVNETHHAVLEGTVSVLGDAPPVAWLAAFGPRASALPATVGIAQADLQAERSAWRALESEVVYLRARLGAAGA